MAMKQLLSRLLKSDVPPPSDRARPRLTRDPADYAAVYAIGDVHGCFQALRALEQRIVEDAAAPPGAKLIVMLGDYVDRGPQSRQVLDHVTGPPPEGFERLILAGNHEEVFLDFLADPQAHMRWLDLGGVQTLLSYGIDVEPVLVRGGIKELGDLARDAVPERHVEALLSAAVSVTLGDIVFVHAGVRPGVAMDEQTDEDMMWIRQPFLTTGPELPIVVVHGHTPNPQPSRAPGRLGIDTGCYATGVLTAVRIIGGEIEIF
ncbi:metallophosphoesterase family protein [Rhizobium halophytocola]|uniref:Serine/threonine protein phosphatase 1 n=1 Tax=Rhizobium halophytocola TaxID=735519 RepID=A0ABS4DSS8_9HYPH|nr:metallophosphoesterase family protein [Rhizobium halophytocola]MBP1848738.1 serine/threonine protein phosphatase 1 [Rhizobium halophytocola]